MYVRVSCWFLTKLLSLEATVGALVHKINYAPMIYLALYVMFLMRANQLLGQVGGGWALDISFFGPQMALA